MRHDFVKYLNPVFIETGSSQGDGIQAAINSGFNEIHSIESVEKYFRYCENRFVDYDYVFTWWGLSEYYLPFLLSDIDSRCTFWLDAHYSGGDTEESYPLILELNGIKKHHIKDHTILIDDMRLFKTEWKDLDYKEKDIKNLLLSINKNYNLSYEFGIVENDILVASI